jgi:hypothetical protein
MRSNGGIISEPDAYQIAFIDLRFADHATPGLAGLASKTAVTDYQVHSLRLCIMSTQGSVIASGGTPIDRVVLGPDWFAVAGKVWGEKLER